jgi:hypothetical protein
LLPGRRLGAGVVLGHVAGQCWGPMLDCDGGVSLKSCFARWLPRGTLLDFAGARCRGVPKSRDMLASGKWRGRGACGPGGSWQHYRGVALLVRDGGKWLHYWSGLGGSLVEALSESLRARSNWATPGKEISTHG